ncbi:transposase [Azospirillum canadense]|uniref:transposase n=1 Tax=Azospirillum canadense TaxID=403962 RepID=UPI003872F6FB|nr:transposase [Azospirillum canadense]
MRWPSGLAFAFLHGGSPRSGRVTTATLRTAEKRYSSGVIRSALRRRGVPPVIPTRSNERPDPEFDRDAYRERNRVERLINRLKQFRRIATRYEKRAVNYLAMITIAAILQWL